MSRNVIIRASELGRYDYCARSWWLERVRGYAPENIEDLQAGESAHLAHGETVIRYHFVQRLAYAILLLAGLAALLLLFLSMRG
ncbi:MAG: hypothetical protein H5T64_01675 [Chloroflexi bacterium]|nr:hypothetical protein [Chloroflexota bacterium]